MRVSNKEKIAFINFLITNYNFKGDNENIKLMLTYIKEKQSLLGRTEFVSGGRDRDKNTIYLTTKETETNHDFDFKLFTDYGAASTIVSSAMSYIKNNYDDKYEIIVNFNGINAPEYRAVVDGGRNEIDLFLDEVQKKREIELIKQSIDDSLAEMNKDKFMALTDKLKQIIG
jgi:uncharacterized protein YpiB (UPF0302 family)